MPNESREDLKRRVVAELKRIKAEGYQQELVIRLGPPDEDAEEDDED